MATPSHRVPLFEDPPRSMPQLSLDDSFLPMLARVAVSRIRAASQEGPGLLRADGPSADLIRALAIRWCGAKNQRARFDPDALEGLAMALQHFEDCELRDLIEGTIVMYGVSRV